MLFRSAICTLVLAAVLGSSAPVMAYDDALYPDLSGQFIADQNFVSGHGDAAERRQTVPVPSHEPDPLRCAFKIDDDCRHQPLGVSLPPAWRRGRAALYALRARSRPLFPLAGGRLRPGG